MRSIQRFISISFLLPSIFLLSSCVTMTAKNLNTRITKTQKEWRYGGHAFYGDEKLVRDLTAQGQLQAVLDRIIYVSPLRGYSIPIFFVDSQNPAFTDGKSIYINAAFAQVFWQDQSMIALVIAHEFGHILAHHDPASGKDIATLYSAASPLMSLVPYGGYANLAVREGVTMGKRAYNRAQEKEADAIAVYLAKRAGYDPQGLVRFFDYIQKARQGQSGGFTIPITNYANPSSAATAVALSVLRSSSLYKTHPSPKQRIYDLEFMIKQMNAPVGVLSSAGNNDNILSIYRSLDARSPK